MVLSEGVIVVCPPWHYACLFGDATATQRRQPAKLNWAQLCRSSADQLAFVWVLGDGSVGHVSMYLRCSLRLGCVALCVSYVDMETRLNALRLNNRIASYILQVLA